MKLPVLAVCCLVFCSRAWSLTEDEMSKFKSRPHAESNTGLQATVTVMYGPKDKAKTILLSNGIPDHNTGTFPRAGNPNSITAQSYNWKVKTNPEFKDGGTTQCLPMGPIAMAINGVAIYNPYTRTCCDAGTAELGLFDTCTGHPGPSGQYHYHIYPTCLEDIICETPSGILGVAFDGFPIYGPISENGTQLTAADLDECNGRFDSQGNYKYHVIKEFPYFMGCYKGKVIDTSINTGCKCTEPVKVCTEFGGGGRGLPQPSSVQGRKKRATENLFTCCTDNQTCSESRIFVHDDGNGSHAPSYSALVLTITLIAVFFERRD